MTEEKTPLLVQVTIADKQVAFEVDTGASRSAINKQPLQTVCPEAMKTSHPFQSRLLTYTEETVKVAGIADVQAQYQGQTESLPLLVVETDSPALPGRDGQLHIPSCSLPRVYRLPH